MCIDPAEYPWSSHAANALGHDDGLAHTHPTHLASGATREKRCATYRAIARETLSD